MKFLADSVLFIIDEQQPIEQQEALLNEIKTMFTGKVHVAVNDKLDAKGGKYTVFNATNKEDCEGMFLKCFGLDSL